MLTVDPFVPLNPAGAAAVTGTGRELLAFVTGDPGGRVGLSPVDLSREAAARSG